jgi:dihydropyrimidinase
MVVDDFTLYNVLKLSKEARGMVSVHAENYSMITNGVAKLIAEGKTAPYYHALSRPDYVEAEAISRAIMWAEETGGKLYVVHLSTAKGLELIKAAKRRGVDVTAETCPQYLILTEENYKEPRFQGAKYVMSPPLRTKDDNAALWEGLADGSISTVASDHCPFSMEQKKMGLSDFSKIPNGAPGIETILPLLYSEGVRKKRISLERLVELCSANPAKLFGLSAKGAIEPGKDADVTLIDPKAKKTLGWKTLHTKSDNSPFEGLEVQGYPCLTMSRGKVVMKDGEFTGSKGYGKLIQRAL